MRNEKRMRYIQSTGRDGNGTRNSRTDEKVIKTQKNTKALGFDDITA